MNEIKNKGKQIVAIDFVKIFAAYMIVFLHCGIYQKLCQKSLFIGYLSIPIWAVPFFFCVAGFFLYRHIDKYGNIYSTIKRLIILYILWTVIYAPYNLIIPIIKGTFSLSMYLKCFFVLGSYAHLWFIPALIYVYIIIVLIKNEKLLSIIAIIGLIYGLVGSSYFNLISEVPLVGKMFSDVNLFDKIRRFMSLDFPFVMMGYLIAKNYKFLNNISMAKLYRYLLLVFLCYVLEIYTIVSFNLARDSFDTVFQIPLVFLIFIICINTHFKNEEKLKKCATWCRKASIFIYFVHYFIITTLFHLLGNSVASFPIYLYLFTLSLSTLLAYIVINLDNPFLNRLIM